MKDHLDLKAYAKINLGLDVVRKREDGYHEVRMIMQTVNLYDRRRRDQDGDESPVRSGRGGKPCVARGEAASR